MKWLAITVMVLGFVYQPGTVQGQSELIDSLKSIPSQKEQLSFLEKYMNQYVYSDPPKSIQVAFQYDSIARQAGDIRVTAKAMNLLGMAHYVTGQYDQSFEYYVEAIKLEEYLENPKDRARLRNNLATCYQIRGDIEKSIEYYESALTIYEAESDSLWIANINGNLGLLLLNGKEIEKAEPKIRRALDYYQNHDQPVYEGYTLLNLGNLLVEKKVYEESIATYKKAMELVPDNINPLVGAAANSGTGIAYSRMGEYNSAILFLKMGLKISEQIDHKEQIKICHQELALIYERLNNPSLALNHFKKYSAYKDSMFTIEQDAKMVEALTKYESEKQEQEIALLNSQNETVEARLTGITRLLIFFGVALLILSILIYRLIHLNKKVKQSAAEKDTLLREIHHRVKNNLQVISALLTLQSSYVKDKQASEALREGQDRVQSMALIHKDLYQHDNLKGVNTKDYLEKLIDNLVESYKVDTEHIQLDLDIESIWLDVDTMIPMGLMINELISNALKHAFGDQNHGLLSISLKERANQLVLKIADNGSGYSNFEQQNSKSFGYSLINSFAKKLKADIAYPGSDGFQIEMRINEYVKAA